MTEQKYSPQQAEFDRAQNKWREITSDPKSYLISSSNRFYVAFGHGATLLDPRTYNELSRQLKIAFAQKGLEGIHEVSLAGVFFTQKELVQIGKFYRELDDRVGICMDERVAMAGDNVESGIHKRCGAAQALGLVIEKTGQEVEDEAVKALCLNGKQELLPDMDNQHESLSVLIDFSDNFLGVRPEVKKDLRENAALPFGISLPLDKIEAFMEKYKINSQRERTLFIKALLKFNLGIAQQIIGGSHNKYKDAAAIQGIFIITNEQGVNREKYPDFFSVYNQYIDQLRQSQPILEIPIV